MGIKEFFGIKSKEQREADEQRRFYKSIEDEKKSQAEYDRLKGEAEYRSKNMELKKGIEKQKQIIMEAKRYDFQHSNVGRVVTAGQKVGGTFLKKVGGAAQKALVSRIERPKKVKKIKRFSRGVRIVNAPVNINYSGVQPRVESHPSFMPREERLPPIPDLLGGPGKIPDLLGKGKSLKMNDLLGIGHKRRTGRKTNIFRLY